MVIRKAEFITSSTQVSQCPPPDLPEFAFIGRSNVGKSSLINMLAGRKNLARISNQPGKTQTINHFLIDDSWYLVDLPGYGFAKVSQQAKYEWSNMTERYFIERTNLYATFILVDSRLEPQASDLDFIQWLGSQEHALAIVMTKIDKLSRNEIGKSIIRYENTLKRTWDELPPMFVSSAETDVGKVEILDFIDDAIKGFKMK